ncbi:hypothetical protein LVD15_13660 [Fulvivirga maritima]|uniref:hypothetical protein n=1 Tax=Fulvivirga maritima TaxID=2904247 RepID=UPI001F3C8467|nr:hypothetical protein [Fulvivirga maritima]UII29428.1 hypothetical protein LVD15_13660 [Fulvivirga maritima]
MKALIFLFISLTAIFSNSNEKIREIEYNGTAVKTTFNVPVEFYGKYAGRKSGYLQINEDGSGVYNYDIFGFAPSSCEKGAIDMEWGFLLNENNEIVKFEREYGLSYPVLMKSTGATQFQGCRTPVMLDFILVRKNGSITVSSSDDWEKVTE